MAYAREFVLRKAKEPAKVFSMDGARPAVVSPAAPVSAGPNVVEHAAGDRCGDGRPVAVAAPAQGGTLQQGGPKPPRPPVPGGGSARAILRDREQRRRPSVEANASRRSPSLPAESQAGDAGEVVGAAARRGPRGNSRARSVSAPRTRLGDGSPAPAVEHKDLGKVPAYIKRRQEEAAEQKRVAALPTQPRPPPGYRLVGGEEKEESLRVLRQRRQEAARQQEKLPFRIETPGQKKREQELTDRIARLDKLIGMFSKPTVFYPQDADSIPESFSVQQQDGGSSPPPRAASPGGGGVGALLSGGAPAAAPACAATGAASPGVGSPGGGDGACRSGAPRAPRHQGASRSPSGANLGFGGYAPVRQKQLLHTGVQIMAPPGGNSSLSLRWG